MLRLLLLGRANVSLFPRSNAFVDYLKRLIWVILKFYGNCAVQVKEIAVSMVVSGEWRLSKRRRWIVELYVFGRCLRTRTRCNSSDWKNLVEEGHRTKTVRCTASVILLQTATIVAVVVAAAAAFRCSVVIDAELTSRLCCGILMFDIMGSRRYWKWSLFIIAIASRRG